MLSLVTVFFSNGVDQNIETLFHDDKFLMSNKSSDIFLGIYHQQMDGVLVRRFLLDIVFWSDSAVYMYQYLAYIEISRLW